MKLIRFTDPNYASNLNKLLADSSLFEPVIEERTRDIIREVKHRGDAALLNFAKKFDNVELSTKTIKINKTALQRAWKELKILMGTGGG